MNILWISHIIPYPPKTGVLQRSYNLLREASKIGDVYLLALHKKGVLPVQYDLQKVQKELLSMCKHVEIMEIPAEASKVKLYELLLRNIFTSDSLSVTFYKSKEMHRKIRGLVSKVKFDIAHFDTISLAEFSEDVGDIKKILNHHNIESDLFKKRSLIEKNILKKLYYKMEASKLKRYEASQCNKFDINFTVSDLDSQLLAEVVPGVKTEVVPNAVDIEYFHKSKADVTKNRLIILCGMNWYPNRDMVIHMCREIWPLLTEELPDISMTVVGAQPPEVLVDLAQKDERVEVTGFVDDVRPYLESAEVYLCPMRDGGGTRLKILDAMSMGKAIVSSTKGCEGIDATPNKHVLIADTPPQFVNRIKEVLLDPELRIKLGEEARLLVTEKYSWKVVGKSLKRIYGA